MTSILAIDPGSTYSAYVILSPAGRITDSAKLPNTELIAHLRRRELHADLLAMERMACYGMRRVGSETFETEFWAGRFIEAWGRDWDSFYRRDVKMFLCGSVAGADDAAIRQRLIDLYGPTRQVAVGTRAKPGPLYGITADRWQALAVALTARDRLTQAAKQEGAA